MRKFVSLFVLLSVLGSFSISAQENSFTKEEATRLVTTYASALQLSEDEVKDAFISDFYYNKAAGTKMVYLQQGYKGVALYNVIKSIAFRNDKPVSNAGFFERKLAIRANVADGRPLVSAADAIVAAASNVGKTISQPIIPVSEDASSNKKTYSNLGVSNRNVTTKLLWVPNGDVINLCWQVKIAPLQTADIWLINVDAVTGTVIGKDNLTIYDNWTKEITGENRQVRTEGGSTLKPASINTAAYRVVRYPSESPNHINGTPSLVTNPWDSAGAGSMATTLGWHNDGLLDHDSTRGNNVWAREDRADNDGSPLPGRAAVSTTSSPSLTFDFPFNSAGSPTSTNNQNFAITQLFYWNNIMHDITYLYGFDEVSGNFQNNNMGRGGQGNDYVIADAQDGGGTNNANFGTDEDGLNPRMQMYLWGSSGILKVNSPGTLAGNKTAAESNVSVNNKLADKGPITANVVLYNAVANDACTTTTSSFQDNIVLIDRGTCNYNVKIKNAQLAGAKAVIVINNVSGNPFVMTGTDNTITIPAVMISLTDGTAMKTAITAGQNVNVTLGSSALDGDLDNGVMGHEYTHGISNRLTGGPANASCLTNKEQMGEGWSDYYALMMTTDWATAQASDGALSRPIGTYVIKQLPTGSGIRTYPYTTNMSVNQWTYGKLATNTGGESHNIGEIWATVLWDMTWNLIQMDGINPNFYNPNGVGGNSAALKLVTEGMKLQPCRPGFLDGRDGILKADTLLFGGKYSCAIWKAFARRGMGLNAKQGSSDSYTDQVNNTDLPAAVVHKSVDKVTVDMNGDLTYTFRADCQCTPITNYKIVDTLPANVTYVSGGVYNSGNNTVTFDVPSLTEGQSQTFNLTVRVNTGTYSAPVEPLNEPVGTVVSIPATFTATASGSGAWSVSAVRSHSLPGSLKASDPATTSSQTLTSTGTFNLTGISTLSFWHYFDVEPDFDGGVVQLSVNGGTSWIDLGPYMYQNGYNGAIGTDSKRGFTKSSGGQFIQTKVNLAAFAGKQVKLRFVFTSDAGVGGDGWYLDDIILRSEAGVYNIGYLFNSANQLQSSSDTITFINNVVPVTWSRFTAEKQGATSLLKWTTAQENNTQQYVVERSADGNTFSAIGYVNAAGFSAVATNYQLTDETPLRGRNYYRIKQVDRDGRFTYSELRMLSFDGNGSVRIYPNPAKERVTISIQGNSEAREVSLQNVTGQTLRSFVMTGETYQLKLNYPAGVYFIKVKGIEKAFKLVIE